jgi:hypothetical protein
LNIKIRKNTFSNIPVKLKTEDKDGNKQEYWVETEENEKTKTFPLPADDIYKITLNEDYIFPNLNTEIITCMPKVFSLTPRKLNLSL